MSLCRKHSRQDATLIGSVAVQPPRREDAHSALPPLAIMQAQFAAHVPSNQNITAFYSSGMEAVAKQASLSIRTIKRMAQSRAAEGDPVAQALLAERAFRGQGGRRDDARNAHQSAQPQVVLVAPQQPAQAMAAPPAMHMQPMMMMQPQKPTQHKRTRSSSRGPPREKMTEKSASESRDDNREQKKSERNQRHAAESPAAGEAKSTVAGCEGGDDILARQREEWAEKAAIALAPSEYAHRRPLNTFGCVSKAVFEEEAHLMLEHYHVIRDAHKGEHLATKLSDADAAFLHDAEGVACSAPALWELMCWSKDIAIYPHFLFCSITMGHGSLDTAITSGFAYPLRRPWTVASVVKLFRPDSADMCREIEKRLARAGFDHVWLVNPELPTWTTEFWDEDRNQWLPLEAVAAYPHLIGTACRDVLVVKARVTVLHADWKHRPTMEDYRSKYRAYLDRSGLDVALKASPGIVYLRQWTEAKSAPAWQICPANPPQRLAHLQVMFDDLCTKWADELRRALERRGGALERQSDYTKHLMRVIDDERRAQAQSGKKPQLLYEIPAPRTPAVTVMRTPMGTIEVPLAAIAAANRADTEKEATGAEAATTEEWPPLK